MVRGGFFAISIKASLPMNSWLKLTR
jgi:hypothetical protein